MSCLLLEKGWKRLAVKTQDGSNEDKHEIRTSLGSEFFSINFLLHAENTVSAHLASYLLLSRTTGCSRCKAGLKVSQGQVGEAGAWCDL